jgi:hypothetical protein
MNMNINGKIFGGNHLEVGGRIKEGKGRNMIEVHCMHV